MRVVTSVLGHVAAWRDATADDARHDERTAALLGIALGTAFGICFLTGLYSHLAQHPPWWFTLPARPAGLYRVTQGLHVATGIAAVPLLLAKLWAVFPRLLQWPPVTSVAHLLERVSLVPLVAGGLFQLWTGVANIDLWYPLPAFFPAAHYWVAWITVGALIAHIGAKATITASALRPDRAGSRSRSALILRRRSVRRPTAGPDPATCPGALPEVGPGPTPEVGALTRRRFLVATGAASGLLTAVTIGQTVRPLRSVALLAPRDPDRGVQGFPVNKTAAEAGVAAIDEAAYRLEVAGAVRTPVSLTLADLRSFPLREAELPIACVEGWSASRRWRGVRLADVLDAAGADGRARVVVRSLEGTGLYAQSDLDADQARDRDTLLALEVDGETLHPDHGFPVRLIGPNRPGVMQTKWVTRVEVS